MFSRTFLILHLTIILWKQDCAVSSNTILEQNKKVNAIEFAINKYLSPLRKLTAELPNHAIEMQIEFFDQEPSLSAIPVPQRRILRESSRHQSTKKKARSNDDPSSTPAVPTQSDGTTSTTTPETTTEAMTTETTENPDQKVAGRLNVPSKVSGTTLDPRNRPVYMDDLNKALSNLEKKLLKNTSPPTTNTPCSGSTKSSSSPKHGVSRIGTVRNIADILQLLKKAVQVEKHLPQPHDENLDWVQIKIPKDMK